MINNEKSKMKVLKEIFNEHFNDKPTWKDIKHIQFEDDDQIHIGFDEGFYSENNSWDAHFYVIVNRMVEETDEQFNKRMKDLEFEKKWSKEMRYKNYLQLKKEFENGI